MAVFLGRLGIKSEQHVAVGKNLTSIYKTYHQKIFQTIISSLNFFPMSLNSISFIRVHVRIQKNYLIQVQFCSRNTTQPAPEYSTMLFNALCNSELSYHQ